AALRGGRATRLQTSMSRARGRAWASLGVTFPAVAVLSIVNGWPLGLGIDAKSIVLLVLSLFVAQITLATGRSTVLPGVVHLVIFAVYLFTTVVP
ncbi:MAG TPA: ionic transporter y4hA, partial [Burkholderiaceae bacterium]|nr:ionic transporter y4hA [Burkholderiaceae bacterium]